MKRGILILLLFQIIIFCSCSGRNVSEKREEKEENAVQETEYEFSGDEIVVMLTKNKPLGAAPEYDGVLMIYADGRIEMGIGKTLDIFLNRAFDERIKNYLVDHAELAQLPKEEIEEICSLTQKIDPDCGWDGEEREKLPDVVVSDIYWDFCFRWSESGGEKLLVFSGDNRTGTTTRALDENAISAVQSVFDGEYIKDWYAYINNYFRKDDTW